MFVEPLFAQVTAGALVAPVLSNLTVWLKGDSAIWGPNVPATKAYTSVTGNVLFLGATVSQTTTTRDMTETWVADAMTELVTAKQDGTGNLRCDVAIKTAGTIGAGTLTASHPADSSDRFRWMCGWICDLDQVRGGIGGTAASVIAVVQGFVEVTLPVSQPGSLLVAVAWNRLSNTRPLTWTAGWNELDEQTAGTGNEPCGSIASKISTAAGSETVRMTGDGTTTGQWGIVAVELLRG